MATITKLNRFTTLPVLLDLLQRKKLTLLDPKLWDDKNDTEVILEYKRRKKIKNLFALCFSCNDETVHHWKTFSNGSSGCVIEFDPRKLFKIINAVPNLRHRKVEYRKLSDIEAKDSKIKVSMMPFTKRWPYRCEDEYRLIVEPEDGNDSFFDIDIRLDTIRRITISQQMPEQIFKTIKEYLRKSSPETRISRSTLYENKRWINKFTKV